MSDSVSLGLMITQYCVAYLRHDAIAPETRVEVLPNRELRYVRPRDNEYGYYFFSREVAFLDDELLVIRNDIGKSGVHYINCEVFTLQDVKTKFPDNVVLLSTMTSNNYRRVVRTRHGLFQPMHEDDVVVGW